jgi:uncharacterized protein (TIGR02058 family)
MLYIGCSWKKGRREVLVERYVIEFGIGMDFHGQDVNNAARKAVRDAISKSCLSGLQEVLHIDDLDKGVRVKVTVAVTKPELIDVEGIKNCLPVGEVIVRAVHGGLTVPGIYLPRFGDRDDSIEAAIACVEVGIT